MPPPVCSLQNYGKKTIFAATKCSLIAYEWQKGEDSFWKPYIDLIPEITFFAEWTTAEINATQDSFLIKEARECKNQLHMDYEKFRHAMTEFVFCLV